MISRWRVKSVTASLCEADARPAWTRLQLCSFFGRMRFSGARFACCSLLPASLLEALLQNRYQIDHLCRFRRFPWFLFDFLTAGFHFFLDHVHERLAIIVFVFFRLPFGRHAADK